MPVLRPSEEIMKKIQVLSFVPLFILVLVLAACGGSGPSVDVNMTSYKTDLSPTSIAAGSVTFHVKNSDASIPHQFIIVKTDLTAAKLPTDSSGGVDMTQLSALADIQSLAPGGSQDVTVTLQSGHYVIFCNIAGHYASGMYSDFTVN